VQESSAKKEVWECRSHTNKEEGYTKWFEKSEHLPAITSTQDLPISL